MRSGVPGAGDTLCNLCTRGDHVVPMNQDLFDRPSTVDTGARNDLDYYETPSWMTKTLLHHHPLPAGARVLEPCAGDGAIARVLQAAGLHVLTNDVDPRHVTTFHLDATRPGLWDLEIGEIDCVISNPPFNLAFQILQRAYERASMGVAFLLRKTFLEPTRARGAWLSAHPPTHIIGLPRHSFRGTGSDSVSTDWMIWAKALPTYRSPQAIVIDARAKERT